MNQHPINLALLVETRTALRSLFGRLLMATGIAEVLQAEDAHTALSLLEQAEHHNMPHLLVVDLDGTGDDGAALIERLRTHPDPRIAHLSVLAASSCVSVVELRLLAALGVDEIIMKPVSLQQISDSITTIARRLRPIAAV